MCVFYYFIHCVIYDVCVGADAKKFDDSSLLTAFLGEHDYLHNKFSQFFSLRWHLHLLLAWWGSRWQKNPKTSLFKWSLSETNFNYPCTLFASQIYTINRAETVSTTHAKAHVFQNFDTAWHVYIMDSFFGHADHEVKSHEPIFFYAFNCWCMLFKLLWPPNTSLLQLLLFTLCLNIISVVTSTCSALLFDA